MTTSVRRCPYRYCRRRMASHLPSVTYCSALCREGDTGASVRLDGRGTYRRSTWCLYCRAAPISRSGGVTCNSRACRASNSAFGTAFYSTDGVLHRVFLPDVAWRNGPHCGECGRQLDRTSQLDHVVPRARGGDHTLDNLRLLHRECNRLKGTR